MHPAPLVAPAPGAAFLERAEHWASRVLVNLWEEPVKIQSPESKENMIARLRRVEGQVRGVQKMFLEERDCREILQQLAAIHAAVQGVSRTFLQEYASVCLMELDEKGSTGPTPDVRREREKIVQDMIALLDKAP